MYKGSFLIIQDAIRFIEDVFGEKQSFEIESGDAITRNEGRRQGDVTSANTFLEHSGSEFVFSVTLDDEGGFDASSVMPEVFSNPDYCKVLRNRYRELNRTEIQLWRIDYHFSRKVESSVISHRVTFRFTVRYCGVN